MLPPPQDFIQSQILLNEFFADRSARQYGNKIAGTENGQQKKLVISGDKLEYKVIGLFDRVRAFFGFGPAAMKNVVEFCASRGIGHLEFAPLISSYNENHILPTKKIDSVYQTVIRKVEYTSTPLHLACSEGSEEKVAKLLKQNVTIDPIDEDGTTPMMLAAQEGMTDLVGLLLDAHANIEARDFEGDTPLLRHAAEEDATVEMIDFLLERGADLHAQNKKGYNALHHAASNRQTEAIDCLINAGIDMNAPDLKGQTPLHIACMSNQADTVKLLLDRGANRSLKTNDGLTAHDVAVQSSANSVMKLI